MRISVWTYTLNTCTWNLFYELIFSIRFDIAPLGRHAIHLKVEALRIRD